MTSKQAFKFRKGQRVRLRYDCSDVYRRAFGGSEGIVRANKYDETGHFPMVYVHWDKDHWSYNGEDDLWTFESHFDLVEEVMADKFDEFLSGLTNFIESYQNAPDDDDIEEFDDELDEDNPHGSDYEGIVDQAADFARDCEAFILVAVSRQDHPLKPGETILIPEIFTDFKSDEAALLMDSQLSQVSAAAHTEAVSILISRIMRERGKNGPSE